VVTVGPLAGQLAKHPLGALHEPPAQVKEAGDPVKPAAQATEAAAPSVVTPIVTM